MNLIQLGYTQKWIDLNFLDEEKFTFQLSKFKKGEDKTTEHFRYESFINWLAAKQQLTNKEINNYLELAKEDSDTVMAGTAVRHLFVSSKLSDQQFEGLIDKLPQFGNWTKKLITREVLTRRLNKEEMTLELLKLCYDYKLNYKDNRLLISIIKNTKSIELLSLFSELDLGKKLKTLANNKMNKLQKTESNL